MKNIIFLTLKMKSIEAVGFWDCFSSTEIVLTNVHNGIARISDIGLLFVRVFSENFLNYVIIWNKIGVYMGKKIRSCCHS